MAMVKGGAAISTHLDVDMVSYTGSTRAGIAVAKLAVVGVKRVVQELGGKSADFFLLDDVEPADAVTRVALLDILPISGNPSPF